jgi:ferredoxin
MHGSTEVLADARFTVFGNPKRERGRFLAYASGYDNPCKILDGCNQPSSIRVSSINAMPKLTIQGGGQFDVPAGTRLINALVEAAGTDQLHACGGHARCTTCRVKFIEGEPDNISEAEKETLRAREVNDAGIRLSCQIACESDMTVELISRLEGSGRADQGSPPAAQIEPEPVWTTK